MRQLLSEDVVVEKTVSERAVQPAVPCRHQVCARCQAYLCGCASASKPLLMMEAALGCLPACQHRPWWVMCGLSLHQSLHALRGATGPASGLQSKCRLSALQSKCRLGALHEAL